MCTIGLKQCLLSPTRRGYQKKFNIKSQENKAQATYTKRLLKEKIEEDRIDTIEEVIDVWTKIKQHIIKTARETVGVIGNMEIPPKDNKTNTKVQEITREYRRTAKEVCSGEEGNQ